MRSSHLPGRVHQREDLINVPLRKAGDNINVVVSHQLVTRNLM